MKKFYLVLFGVCISFYAVAQIPLTWGAKLADDFDVNPHERQEIKVRQIDDAFILGAATLEGLWPHINPVFVNSTMTITNQTVKDFTTGEEVSTELPAQDAADFTAEWAMLASPTNLYLVYKVVDAELDHAGGDNMEIVLAPYGDAYDPGRTVHPFTGAAWRWNSDTEKYKWGDVDYGVDTIHAMAGFGLWGETGAVKLGAITPATEAELYAGTMFFQDITTQGDTLDGSPDFGTTTVPLMSLYEPSTDGYYFLLAMPWALFANDFKLMEEGDAMSLAVQIGDFDSDNPTYVDKDDNTVTHRYNYWGGSDHNDTYWAVAYYGALAELVIPVGISKNLADEVSAYYASNRLFVEEDVLSLDIYSVSGALVRSVVNASGSIDLSDLENGLYIATMQDINGESGALKFIKY